MTQSPHLPVLLNELVQAFDFPSLRIIVDGTLGAGGHAAALLTRYPSIDCYIGIDQDLEALSIAKDVLNPWSSKIILKHANFAKLDQVLDDLKINKVDGILADIGVSSIQLDRADRGFSFMRDGPLDMRMNKNEKLTAAIIVNEWSESELGKIFRDYGEEKKWRVAAKAIVENRVSQPILTTAQLVHILTPVIGGYSKKGCHPATLIFQALRICVNKELDVLSIFLKRAIERLTPQGRLAIISFHSLEDRLVKNEMRFAADDKWNTTGLGGLFQDKDPTVRLLTKKPVVASEDECKKNPRSRSAKMRVIEKLGD